MRIDRFLVLGFLVLGVANTAAAEAELMEAPKPEAAETDSAPAAGDASKPEVARAIVTRAVADREPVDEVTELRTDQSIVYFFTELRNLEGATVTHRWELDGKRMAEVPFTVASPRWRVWSSKSLQPEWLGNWVVSVVGSGGEVLETASFRYTSADPEGDAPAAPVAPR